jgi:hypothetical protein
VLVQALLSVSALPASAKALTELLMKSVVVIMFVYCTLDSSSAWAIDCLNAPGDPKTGWYSWREIDGRKCWFRKTGAMPPKSLLHWSAKVGQEARSIEPVSPSKERTEPEAAAPPPAETTNRPEPQPPTLPRFTTARVKPAAGASLRLGNGLDLMNGASLSAMQAIGGARRKPASRAPADPFNARFTGSSD